MTPCMHRATAVHGVQLVVVRNSGFLSDTLSGVGGWDVVWTQPLCSGHQQCCVHVLAHTQSVTPAKVSAIPA